MWDLYYFIKSFFFLLYHDKKKLSVLYVYADTSRYSKAYKNMCKLLRRLRVFEITIVKINNFNDNKEVRKESENVFDIGGDNHYWEFSGWKKGLAFLNESGIKTDIILFINDSFLNREQKGFDLNYYKYKINTFSIYGLKDKALGKVDYHNEIETFSGINVSSWIRSNIFVIPKSIADKLQFTFMDEDTIDKIFPETFTGSIFKNNDILNSNLQMFLENWITSKWARSQHVTSQNWKFIKSKLISILNERLLTAKLRENNTRIIDIDER